MDKNENSTISDNTQLEGGYFSRGKIYQHKSYRWEPHEDITAYELAQCMLVVITAMRGFPVENTINDLPENCKRHFTEE